MKTISYICLLGVLLIGCSKKPNLLTYEGQIMGTYYSVKLFAESSDPKLSTKIKNELERVNNVFSTYEKDSELSRLNRSKAGEKIMLGQELMYVLDLSKRIHSQTSGYFDVTVGPVVNAWGFGPDKIRMRPSKQKLKSLKENVGMELFSLDEKSVQKKKKDVYIDLSAIAKGYAVDHLLLFLKKQDYKSALVEIGGEVRSLGKKLNGKPWLIGIEKPSESLGKGIQAVVALENMAMATSGSYRNYVKYGDEVFGHTIDPITGEPANNTMISVTVLSPECAKADAYATAMLAMGIDKAKELAKKLKLAAYFIVKKGERVDIVMSEAFKPFIKEI
ncbi:MAG: hypothetical protein CME64_17935 [Halobacteriovoraceae bacterium]|nr:hypothetical protein [Halobacteriovoraceae bacterium]|tara:strand:- start:22309 stop:23307 length:999 start_codon:yes stop_codon:yes gene_type:complete